MKGEVIEHSASGMPAVIPREVAPRKFVPVPQEQLSFHPLLRILSFFALMALVAIGLDQLITLGLRRIPTSGFGVSNQIFSGRINADIVVSGSSRAQVQYDPSILQQVTGLKAFNIGRNGSQTDMQLAVLKGYLKHNCKPRLLIHNLDSFSFQTSREVYDPAQYLPYLREPEIYQSLSLINPQIWKSRYIPLYGYAVEDMRFTWMRGLQSLCGLFPKEDCLLGFSPGYRKWTGDFERYRAMNPHGVHFEIEQKGEQALEELVSLCRREGIPVLLVYSPVYFEMQEMERDRPDLFSRFHRLSARYQALFWDYSNSAICYERDLFYNSQHLNAEGAKRFSLDLAQRLAAQRPWEATRTGAEHALSPSNLGK